jgi:hypothetical protein
VQTTAGKETRAIRGHITRTLLRDIENERYARLEVIGDKLPDPFMKLKPVSGDERALRNISIEDYEKDEAFKEKAKRPYERWMRFKILEALEKEGAGR